MKNKYFGDINDYRKYGLLRLLIGCGEIKTAVCWMLTRDDSGPDGGNRQYLQEPERWRSFDPQLYQFLHEKVIQCGIRDVRALEGSNMLGDCRFYTNELNDHSNREEYFEEFLQKARDATLVFFDPDNGMEVPSKPFGRYGSSKYLYWREVQTCFSSGHSLLIYQHFPRRRREEFIRTRAEEFITKISEFAEKQVSCVYSYRTANVVFFLVPQPAHEALFAHAQDQVANIWVDQIKVQTWRPLESGTGRRSADVWGGDKPQR